MTGKEEGVDMTTAQSETAALANPISVDVYRNLSKVILALRGATLTGTNTTVTIPGADLSNIKYTLASRAKDAYFSLQTDASSNVTTLYDDVSTDFDRFFTPMDTARIPATDYIPVLPENTATNKTGNGFYAFENVPKIASPVYGATTNIIIQAVITPNVEMVATYNIANKATTVTAPGSATVGASFYVYRPSGAYWTPAARAQAIVAGGTYSLKASDFDYYRNGVCFFPAVAVRDKAGKLGVERNHLYVVTITKINKIGEPAQPYTPPTPVVDDTYMTITAEVHPWDYEATEIEL